MRHMVCTSKSTVFPVEFCTYTRPGGAESVWREAEARPHAQRLAQTVELRIVLVEMVGSWYFLTTCRVARIRERLERAHIRL